MTERTDEELRQAVDAMFRIRAVESPPDDRGERTIWHRGTRGAELVSWVDAAGAVYRHELTLFDDLVLWTKENGVKTGAAKRVAASMKASADLTIDHPRSQPRVDRAWRAMNGYLGDDAFLGHLKALLDAERSGLSWEEHVVTRPDHVVRDEFLVARQMRTRRRPGLALIGLGLLVILAALASLLLR